MVLIKLYCFDLSNGSSLHVPGRAAPPNHDRRVVVVPYEKPDCAQVQPSSFWVNLHLPHWADLFHAPGRVQHADSQSTNPAESRLGRSASNSARDSGGSSH